MNGAQYLCKILERRGVKHIFGLFGDIQADFAHAVEKSSIRWIGVHNEKCGGFMADTYGRVAGQPGVVFSTLGPGATNLTSALANATHDRSPLIAISDQIPLSDFHREAHQYIDFEKAFHHDTGITKYATVVRSLTELPMVLNKAFSVAMTEPRGAVHISMPMDLLGKQVLQKSSVNLLYRDSSEKKIESSLSFSALVKSLCTPLPGVVIAGGSIERNGARDAFRAFVEKWRLPVLTTFRGKNAFPSSHPQCLGTISRHLGSVLGDILKEAAYVLTIGFDYNEGVKPSLWKDKQYVYNIDEFDNRIQDIFSPPSLFGDLQQILKNLSNEKKILYEQEFSFSSTKDRIKHFIAESLSVGHKDLHPGRIIEAVNALYSEGIIVCDVGLNKYYSGLMLSATDNNRILFSNGQSSMAFTSGAMGAKLANPKKDVIALVGDGGFLMDPQETLTAVHYKQPVVWVIFNNGGLGLIEQAQQKNGKHAYGVKFGKVFFSHLAEAFGLYGIRVEPGMDLLSILRQVKRMKRPALIDVPLEYTPKRKTYRS